MTNDALFEQLKHPNPHMQQRAMVELAAAPDESTIVRLVSLLGEPDTLYRRAAVKALGVIGPASVPMLIEPLLQNDDAVVRSSCAKAMAQIAVNWSDAPFPSEGITALRQAIDDANPVVHIAAVMALGEMGPAGLDVLMSVLSSTENVAVAVAITNALGSKGESRAAAVLSSLAEDETIDPYVRESASSALSRLEQVRSYSSDRG